MIVYREAHPDEAETIARLHTQSWRKHYRGILRDSYLDQEIESDRLQVWQPRFQNPKETQHIVVAADDKEVCGFACTYAQDHKQYGALLDNLHVLSAWQGQGIGRKLIKSTAHWVHQQYSGSGLYLWVFEENTEARAFYERIGGRVAETSMVENPGGGSAPVLRIVWPNPEVLL